MIVQFKHFYCKIFGIGFIYQWQHYIGRHLFCILVSLYPLNKSANSLTQPLIEIRLILSNINIFGVGDLAVFR
ncbi:hypothetical protein SAMN05216388_105018 [Halorientalis persicus]|uniref:Uncharacterized protein n=1 Tax=Halorientalis persicus TaxID=1367881 RepID=A0A1H8W7R4_9EURY|nr:hypothetical protein SAMN05216388_105018 [Halorientalis persicus]